MGSDKMANSLMLIAYPASDGKNVTVSPRLASGDTEPTYTSNVTVQLLGGSEVTTSPDGSNNTLTVNGLCMNCRSWSGGSIDVTSKAQKMIFAYGPYVGNPDSVNADLRMHSADGVFTMDLIAATGPGGLPVITDRANNGATEISFSSTHYFAGPIHGKSLCLEDCVLAMLNRDLACIMVLTFVGLLPVGTLILRVMGWTKVHGINQTFASILGLIGAGLGIYIGTLFNRVSNSYLLLSRADTLLKGKKFNSGHQIFGILIIIAMIVQLVLGIMHHRIYIKTQQSTKMAPIHVWLGRIVIACGAANGFL
jgi:Cytochrome domain of cellobiose dehydrogenase